MAQFEGFCPVRNILSQIGDKWSVLALVSLQKYGVCRFRDFQKDMPDVSRKMLSQTLRRLEDFKEDWKEILAIYHFVTREGQYE